ncbi:Cilia- and flagella-associated protein 57 [Thoreauomyces humboldtii]|nr:Cilia- and flagella-associated protein 57 [Thoreauomyces humboldtii]
MSLPSVFTSHVFGVNRDVRNNVCYLDEQTVLYPAGTQIVSYNTEQRSQHFMGVYDGEGITAMAANSAATMIAVAVRGTGNAPGTAVPADERGAGREAYRASSVFPRDVTTAATGNGGPAVENAEGAVVLYDLQTGRKKKVLLPGDVNTKEFISVGFSVNGTHVIAQAGGPDWNIYIWDWDKAKLRGTVKSSNNANAEIHQMSVSPYDATNTQVCVTGNGVFRTYKHAEGFWKLMHQHKSDKNLLCNAYLSESRILVGTEDSKLQVFEAGELILELTYLPPNVTVQHHLAPPAITDLRAFSTGVMAGTSTGVCVLFERTDDSTLLKKTREFFLEEDAVVACIALNPAEDAAVVTLKNSQIYMLPLDYDPGKTEQTKCVPLAQPFHNGAINGMDTAARKPIIATCGADRTIRIWNYMDNTIEVTKTFYDEPLSIAVHPSGLYLLVGFTDGLKLMNVLIDDIEQFWETPVRSCKECYFSNGGQYFAAVHGSTVLVYNMWTLEVIGHLKAHQSKIRSISWSMDDTRIISCGLDGVVYDWSLKTMKKESELVVPNVVFNQAIYTPDVKLAYAIGSDAILRELSDGHVFREFSTKQPLTNTTSKFTMRALRYPFPQDTPYDFTEHSYHSAPITRLRMAYDDQYVFTCGDDGCLWVFRLNDREQRGAKRDKDYGFSDEILVTKSDLKENFKMQTELRRKVEVLKADNEMQLRIKDMNYSTKLQELEDKYANEVDGLQKLIATLEGEHKANVVKYAEEMVQTQQANKTELQEVNASFKFKFEDVTEKYSSMQERSKELKSQWEGQISGMQTSHEARMEEIKSFFQGQISERIAYMASLKQESAAAQTSHDVGLSEIMADTEAEQLHIAHGFEHKLFIEREALETIKVENSQMHVRFDELTRGVDDQKSEMLKRQTEEKRLQSICRALEKDIMGFKREIEERDNTIQDKAKRIYDLKKKNQELEKFKFVLDYKIMELRKQVEPREEDIIVLSSQIKEMDDELQGYHRCHDDLGMATQDLLMRLRAAQNEVASEGWQIRQTLAALGNVQDDVAEIAAVADDLNAVKRVLISVHHKHTTETRSLTPPPPAPTSLHAVLRPSTPPALANAAGPALPALQDTAAAAQRDHLERTIATLEKRLQKEDAKRYKQNLKMLKENTVLLGLVWTPKNLHSEINLLRKDIKSSEKRTSKLCQMQENPSRTLTRAENDFVNPDQHLLRDGLLNKRRSLTMPGALKLLKGDIPTLSGLPPV